MYFDHDWSQGLPAVRSPLPEQWLADSLNWPDNKHAKNDAPPKVGTWFDEAIDLREPHGDEIASRVLSLMNEVEKRKRKLPLRGLRNRYTLVRKLLANGVRCHLHREPALVAYFRKADAYRDKPQWLSGEAIAKAVKLLRQAELVSSNRGFRGTSSTYQVTERLMTIADECGVSGSSLVINVPPERLIRLYGPKPERALEHFIPTPDTEHWTALLEAYNGFIALQDVAIELTEDEKRSCVAHLNRQLEKRKREGSKSGLPYIRPELFRTDLCRVFNNSSFEQGGRLYGGWWISMPKTLRRKITVNGQPTIELDYSGCAIRMLYHERGIDYRDDPYFLEPVAKTASAEGLPYAYFRDAIKDMMQAMINEDDPNKHPEQIRIEGFTFRPHFKRDEIMAMILDKHEPIADSFRTGAGLRLQKSESDLVLEIITSLKDQGIPALPIHDSIMVSEGERLLLEEVMNNNYLHKYGFRPIISNI
ncbi:MAG: hypothetical protein ACTS1X_10655 [Parasphingopyxis sp.]|uniref:hypothetical protein n=1 Tax=Parasphingopyxis sp. TaxID=1920299 RepID=UPI003FA02497